MPIGTNSFVLVKNCCFDVSIYQHTPHDLALTSSFWYKTKFRHNFAFAFFLLVSLLLIIELSHGRGKRYWVIELDLVKVDVTRALD